MTRPRRNPVPTRGQARTLLEFLPRLAALESPVVRLENGFPRYADWFLEFIDVARLDHFMDWDYDVTAAHSSLRNPAAFGRMRFEAWSEAWTGAVRAERFCDGVWDEFTTSGTFARLLSRLEELLPELAE